MGLFNRDTAEGRMANVAGCFFVVFALCIVIFTWAIITLIGYVL